MQTATLAIVTEEPAMQALGFRELYEKHSRDVFLAALRVTGNPADAEDVLQTVFLRIFGADRQIDAAGFPGAYLRRAAVNASIDLLRRKKSRPETEFDELPRRAGPRPVESGERTLLEKERLRAALARISPEKAELFILRYLEGYSYDELADMLGIERGTVGSRLHRIRATLQDDLRDESAEPTKKPERLTEDPRSRT